MDLVAAFKDRLPDFAAMPLRANEEAVEVGFEDGKPCFRVRPYRGEWLLEFPEAHAHLESLEEAFELLGLLLSGRARATKEFRGEELAAAWIEEPEEDHFVQTHVAVYLSPFDVEEWELWPGEQWRQVRTTRTWNASTGDLNKEVLERTADEPTWDRSSTDWFLEGLGSPLNGMKWAVGLSARFVFQVPKGFRRLRFDQESGCIDFTPASGDLLFRACQYFRDAELPAPSPAAGAVRPMSIEYEREDGDKDWSVHRWTLNFSNGDLEMMGILELFFQPGQARECEPLQRIVHSACKEALFVPEHWDVTRAPE